jgi:prepilin-type N-terminal cleavage/methylation domain-containing protein
MKFKFQVSSFKFQVARPAQAVGATCNLQPATCNSPRAFSLVELLVVISILGLLAGLAVPAVKDLGKANARLGAVQQLMDDMGRAHQLAMSQHTTVYMVFVPTNYFLQNNTAGVNFWAGLGGLTDPVLRALAQTSASNLLDRQLSGYRFMSYGRLGDQPGQHVWHYLDDKWSALPEGTFISTYKFTQSAVPLDIPDWRNSGQHPNADGNRIYPFQKYNFPFPTEDSPLLTLPCIAFNHQGQLVQTLANNSPLGTSDAYIPLEQGVVGYAVNSVTKLPTPSVVSPADILERPPGNSTNIGYHLIHIDALTGRARQEFFKVP